MGFVASSASGGLAWGNSSVFISTIEAAFIARFWRVTERYPTVSAIAALDNVSPISLTIPPLFLPLPSVVLSSSVLLPVVPVSGLCVEDEDVSPSGFVTASLVFPSLGSAVPCPVLFPVSASFSFPGEVSGVPFSSGSTGRVDSGSDDWGGSISDGRVDSASVACVDSVSAGWVDSGSDECVDSASDACADSVSTG